MHNQPEDQPKSTFDQRGQRIYGPQTNVAGDQHIYHSCPEPTPATPPAPSSDFVGRTKRLAQLAATLTTNRSPTIIALQGMAGIGKTALALQLAERLKPAFPGGIFWANLPFHIGSAETILRTWGAFCGADLSQEPNLAVLSDRVRGLLVMRQAEQGALLAILDDVRTEWIATVQALQQSLPTGTRLLLTIRDIDLAIPLNAEVVRLEALTESDARKLLVTCVKPKKVLTPKVTVKALLQNLGYLPLGIRLAAGHITTFAPKPGFDLIHFVTDLTQRALSLLDAPGGPSLAAAFAISYDALSAEQQRVFRYCSVYSPALLTVEHMAGLLVLKPTVVETILDGLVMAALLEWDQKIKGRYILHPLLRQYGYTLLGNMEGTQIAHRQAAQQLQEKNTDPDRGGTPIELLEEVDHWEKAGEWATFLRVVSSLVGSIDHLGYWEEIDGRLVKAQTYLQEHLTGNSATILLSRGTIAFKQARWNDAMGFYQQALTIYEQADDRDNMATTWLNLGNVCHRQGRWDEAISFYQQALATFQQIDKLQGMAQTLGNLGLVSVSKGEFDKSVVFYQQALTIYKQIGDYQGIAQIWGNLGNLYQHQSEWDKAIDFYQQTLVAFEQLGDIQSMANTYNNLSFVFQNKGEWDKAISFCQQALTTFGQLGDIYGKANAYNNLGSAYQGKNEWDKANNFYQQALVAFEQLNDTYGLAQTYGNLSIFCYKQGNVAAATNYMIHAYLLFRQLGATQQAQQASTMLVNLFGTIDVNQYLVRVMENKWIETQSEVSKGLTLEILVELVMQARCSDHILGERLYHHFLPLSMHATQLPETQALSKVLMQILVGINDPDFSALPTVIARAVQRILIRNNK